MTKLIGYAETGLTTAKFVRKRKSDGAWWNTSGTPAFEAYNAANIASYGIAATETGASTEEYTATDPADGIEGQFVLVKAAGASLAVSDLAGGKRWQDLIQNLPSAAPGAAGGLLISGSNAGTTTFGALTITGQLLISDGMQIDVATTNRSAFKATGNGTGHGGQFLSGTGASGNGLQATSQATNGTGIGGTGAGTGNGWQGTGGASGNGARFTGSASGSAMLLAGGTGISISASLNDGILIQAGAIGINITNVGATSAAISLTAGTVSGDAIVITTTDGDGLNLSGIAGAGQYGINGTLGPTAIDAILIESGISASVSLVDDSGAQLTSINARQALALAVSALAGVLAGAAGPTTTMHPAGKPAASNRISAAVDATGRTAITLRVPT